MSWNFREVHLCFHFYFAWGYSFMFYMFQRLPLWEWVTVFFLVSCSWSFCYIKNYGWSSTVSCVIKKTKDGKKRICKISCCNHCQRKFGFLPRIMQERIYGTECWLYTWLKRQCKFRIAHQWRIDCEQQGNRDQQQRLLCSVEWRMHTWRLRIKLQQRFKSFRMSLSRRYFFNQRICCFRFATTVVEAVQCFEEWK